MDAPKAGMKPCAESNGGGGGVPWRNSAIRNRTDAPKKGIWKNWNLQKRSNQKCIYKRLKISFDFFKIRRDVQ